MMPADEFYKFRDEDRERVFRISEAHTSDESARRDRMVGMQEKITDAQVRIASQTLWLNASLYVGSVAAVLVSYAFWHSILLSALFLGPAAVKMITSGLVAAVRRRRRDDDNFDVS